MSTVSDPTKNPAQKAVDAKPTADGPHTAKGRKDAKSKTEDTPADREAAFVVNLKGKEDEGEKKNKVLYSPEEVRAKAKAFMSSDKLSPQERRVLQEILGTDKEG